MAGSDSTSSWKTPFGEQMDQRNAHLDALPGRVYRDWFEALNRASRVYGGNAAELDKHVQQFVGRQVFVNELPEEFGFETARLLHNYLAALASLRDVQRVIHRRVWPTLKAPDSDEKRATKWEAEVWTPKINDLFGDEPTVFLVDLRNYSLHYAIPVTSMSTNFQSFGSASGGTAMTNTVAVDRAELLKWDGWRSKGKKHITSAPTDQIDIVTPIATYSTRVREFFAWFWEQITDSARPEITEYWDKAMEFGHYLEVESTVTRFGPDGRTVLRPRLAEARLKRAAFGGRGWRLFSLDEAGEWVVGERDPGWPPLAAGPR